MRWGNPFCASQRSRLRFQFFFFLKRACGCYEFPVDPVHCSRDPQTSLFNNFLLKMSLITLFTYLKIILL